MSLHSTNQRRTLRVLLVDGFPVVRQGIARLLGEQPDMKICGDAANAQDALRCLDAAAPHVLITDLFIGGIDCLELIRQLKKRRPDLPILVLAGPMDENYSERVLRAGARGYLLKSEPPERLFDAIRQLAAGNTVVSEAIASKLLISVLGVRGAGVDPFESLKRLSDREMQVLNLIGSGLTVQQIAEQLFLSPKTVEAHREHIKRKLNLSTSREVLRFAMQHAIRCA